VGAERDPIEALRSLWRGLEPAGGEPARDDAAEREVLAWVRRAWRAVEPPAGATRLREGAGGTRVERWGAAVLLAAAGIAALVLLVVGGPGGETRPAAEVARGGVAPEPRSATAIPSERGGGAVVEAVRPREIVMRSGPVRLHLFTGGVGGPDANRGL